METTTALEERTPQTDAVTDPLLVLDGLVSTLESLESAIAGLQALREYTLAIASRVAEVMAAEDKEDGGQNYGGAPAGFKGARWDADELAQRAVAAEIATATRANDRTIQRQMGQAVELLDRFPSTFAALAHGRISLAHARVIQDAGAALDDPAALARYESVVVECAQQQAPGRVRRVAVREAEKAQPESLASRHERAAEERRVWVLPLPDGMAELCAVLPAAVAYGIHDRLTRMAKAHADLAKAHAYEDAATAHSSTAQDSHTGAFGPAAATQQTGPAQPRQSTDSGQSPGPTRNTDQLRADLLAELLVRGAPTAHDTPDGLLAAITARVDITVPVLTLIGREGSAAGQGSHGGAFRTADGVGHAAAGNSARASAAETPTAAETRSADPSTAGPITPAATAAGNALLDSTAQVPAELDGRHPIDPDTARILAGQVTAWNRVLTDPITGAVLAVDRYRPGEDLKRLLAARDSRCRFPGCGIKARELDLDHTHDAALGGSTDTGNLAGLCRRHHVLKHHSRWTIRQTGAGVLVWISPTGRSYKDSPPAPATHMSIAADGLVTDQRGARVPVHAGDPPPF